MKPLPSPHVYEDEYLSMPWRHMAAYYRDYLIKTIPPHATVVDAMCGPALLLSQLAQARPDLHLTGVDNSHHYIAYSQSKYPHLSLIKHDILTWEPNSLFDVVLCTGSFHHIPFEQQAKFLARLAKWTNPSGYVLLSDPFIAPYSTEKERMLAALELASEYLQEVINADGTLDVIKATIGILSNDVLADGEYKTSVKRFYDLARPIFPHITAHKTWPTAEADYGDYCFILKTRPD